jgi:hypothetical protein
MSIFKQNGNAAAADTGTKQEETEEDDDAFGDMQKAAKKAAEGGERYPFLYSDGACNGVFAIRRVTRFKKRVGKIDTFAIEVMVVENDKVLPGAMRTIMEGADKEGCAERLARLIMASSGAAPEEVTKSLVTMMHGKEQPFTGLLCGYSASPSTKNAEFTNISYRKASKTEIERAIIAMAQIDPKWTLHPEQPQA